MTPSPFPLLVTLALIYLLAQMTWRDGLVVAANQRFRLLLGGCALLSLLVVLRWGYGVATLVSLQAVVTAALAPGAWCCQRAPAARQRWLHALPGLAVLVCAMAWPPVTEPLAACVCTAYGLALLQRAAHLRRADTPAGAAWALAAAVGGYGVVSLWLAWAAWLGSAPYAPLAEGLALGLLLLWGFAASAVAQQLAPSMQQE